MSKARKTSGFRQNHFDRRPQFGATTSSPLAPQAPPVFPPELKLAPPLGGGDIFLPLAVVRDPPAERLLMRKTEPPSVIASQARAGPAPEIKNRAKKTRAASTPAANKRKAAKPVRKTAKPAGKTAAKTSRIKAQIAKAPIAEPTAPILAKPELVKDLAPALPPTAPLPRSAAVQAYRKNGPLDVLAYWLRSTARSIRLRFWKNETRKPKPSPALPAVRPTSELEQLKAENALLRERIEQLLDSRTERERA